MRAGFDASSPTRRWADRGAAATNAPDPFHGCGREPRILAAILQQPVIEKILGAAPPQARELLPWTFSGPRQVAHFAA